MGLMGFLFLSILIISGELARFFDRFFGMDGIIKFQRKFSLVTAFFILSHPVFFILSNKFYLNYLIPNFAALPFAFGTLTFYIFIIVMASSLLYKRISHRAWQYLHILTYTMFFTGLYHAWNVGSDIGNNFIRVLIGVLLIFLVIGIIYRTNYKLKQRKNRFYVYEIKWETHDTFTLKLKGKLNFKPGQFCFLRLNKDKLHARHPFTISSCPANEDLEFTMKITGRFTKAASELRKGDNIIVEGPFGKFTVNEDNKKLVLIAGGVGITPFMSIINNQIKMKKERDIILIYGSKTKKDIIFKKEFDEIKEKWFKKVYVLSQEKTKEYENGVVSYDIIKKYVKDADNSLFYICGPELMKKKVLEILRNMNVKEDNIKIESFFW